MLNIRKISCFFSLKQEQFYRFIQSNCRNLWNFKWFLEKSFAEILLVPEMFWWFTQLRFTQPHIFVNGQRSLLSLIVFRFVGPDRGSEAGTRVGGCNRGQKEPAQGDKDHRGWTLFVKVNVQRNLLNMKSEKCGDLTRI